MRGRYESRLDALVRSGKDLASRSDNYRQKLRVLSENTGAALIMLDEKGTVLHTNSTADRILGREGESVIGHALVQASLAPGIQEFATRVATRGQPEERDFETVGGHPRILRTAAYPLPRGLSGGPEVMVMISDVTELRRLETIRRDFVANVSHELRTPLASIKAMAETLQDGALHDEAVADRFLETIIRESDRLARISEDLLILSDAESTHPEKVTFDLEPFLNELLDRFRPQAARHKISLTISSVEKRRVAGSKDQLEQVFVNLIDNAVKYTQDGGSIRVDLRPAEGGGAVVAITDTGIGMLQEDLPRIFERFYRVDKSRSRESGGTGLGLAIVKNIVEAHGGKVCVESQLNHGTTFTVTLPASKEDKVAADQV